MATPNAFTSSYQVVVAWADAVNRRDMDLVLGLYDSDARLLPTFSPHLVRKPEGRRDYFERLLQRPGLQATLHDSTAVVQKVGEQLEIVSGIYRFSYLIDDVPLVFEARYSFFMNLAASAPILHHHSSQIPRNLS